jgi:hypothetical protein
MTGLTFLSDRAQARTARIESHTLIPEVTPAKSGGNHKSIEARVWSRWVPSGNIKRNCYPPLTLRDGEETYRAKEGETRQASGAADTREAAISILNNHNGVAFANLWILSCSSNRLNGRGPRRHLKNDQLFIENGSIAKINLYSFAYPDYPFNQPSLGKRCALLRDSPISRFFWIVSCFHHHECHYISGVLEPGYEVFLFCVGRTDRRHRPSGFDHPI